MRTISRSVVSPPLRKVDRAEIRVTNLSSIKEARRVRAMTSSSWAALTCGKWITPLARRVSSALGTARGTAPSRGSRNDPGLHRQQALALQFLTRELAGAADGFRFFSCRPLGWLLVEPSPLHLAENPFALHLLLENSESLLNVVVANKNLQKTDPFELVGLGRGDLEEVGVGRMLRRRRARFPSRHARAAHEHS